MNPIRKRRIEKELLKLISNTIEFKMRDKRLALVSIVDVKISEDLGYANIHYRTLSQKEKKEAEKAFQKAAGFIKNEIAKAKILRTIPELRFFYDDTEDRAEKIEELIKKIHEEEK